MHRLVLEDGERRFAFVQQWMPRLFDGRVRERVQNQAVALVGEAPDLVTRWPRGGLTAARRRLVFRIDAAGKQALEAFVDARTTERL